MSDVESRYAEILKRIGRTSMGKRPETVVRHILEHGFITTEILDRQYGYKHAPRAIRDVRDLGIPVKTTTVRGADGKTMARYELTTMEEIIRLGGRLPFPKGFAELVSASSRCALCAVELDRRYLQIDHRVPFPVSGDDAAMEPADFMLLCGSCNRSKSWSCEHCPNWKDRNPDTCRTCYWACPIKYGHVATMDIRRLDMTWQGGGEVRDYEALVRAAEKAGLVLPKYVKQALKDAA